MAAMVNHRKQKIIANGIELSSGCRGDELKRKPEVSSCPGVFAQGWAKPKRPRDGFKRPGKARPQAGQLQLSTPATSSVKVICYSILASNNFNGTALDVDAGLPH